MWYRGAAFLLAVLFIQLVLCAEDYYKVSPLGSWCLVAWLNAD